MKLSKLEVLSQKEIECIHAASVRVLEECGMKILSDKVLDLLEAKGCTVDRTSHICKFPKTLVQEALQTVPKTFDLYDRNGQKRL